MKKLAYITIFGLMACNTTHNVQDAKSLISKVVEANGGVNAFNALKDVSFDYTFRFKEKGLVDISTERYIFEGEVSYGQYTKRQFYAIPQMEGMHTQFFDGTNTVSKLNGETITEEQPAYIAHSLRKTNYYWFAMMFKLLDTGVNLKMMPIRNVDGISYKIVEMTFGKNVGDVSDRYLLYVNPETYRIDQFLYTALAFGATEPSLMKIEYEKIDEIYVSTYRKYTPADWQGNVIKEDWTEQLTKNVKFNNGFDLNNIQSPF